MGHYASEMDPDWGKENERINRGLELRELVADLPVMAGDLLLLMRLFNHEFDTITDEEYAYLKRKAETYHKQKSELEKKVKELQMEIAGFRTFGRKES